MSKTSVKEVQSYHSDETSSKNISSKEESVEIEDKSIEIREEVTETEKGSEETPKSDHEHTSPRFPRKKKYIRWIMAIVLLVVFLCAGTYGGVAFYYKSHFLPNTIINTVVCSNMEAVSAAALLDARIEEYTLEVTGRDCDTGEPGTVLGIIVPSDIELAYEDSQGVIDHLLSQQNSMLWIQVLSNQTYIHSVVQGVIFDEDMLEEVIKGWDACQRKNMRKPENAYISEYSESVKGYQIIPETEGTQLDVEYAIQCIEDALLTHQNTVDLEDLGCYIDAPVTREDQDLIVKVETANRWLRTEISYDWNGNNVKLDAEVLKDWIHMEQGGPVLDEDAVAEYVKSQAREWDTYGRKRKFVTTLGIELTLPSGYYGWQTDRKAETEELIQMIYQGSVLEREPIYSSKAMQKGVNDIGDSYVEADLSNQHLYLYIDGEVVLETDFVSGKMSVANCVTPPGVFGISYKTRNAVLRGPDYETPVKYWMPFYGNYGMHDASWRRTFGGDIYLTNGSHGCINLPPGMASKIYEYMEPGFPVICYYYTQEQIDSLAPEVSAPDQPGEPGQPPDAVVPDQPGEPGQSPDAVVPDQPGEPGQPPDAVVPDQPGEPGQSPDTVAPDQPGESQSSPEASAPDQG